MVSVGVMLDGRYKLLRPLSSEGGTADVWLAHDTNTIDEGYDEETDGITVKEDSGIEVAIKIYRPKNALDIGDQRFREEFKIVFKCHHTNLVQPINFSIWNGIPYLVLPYCKEGSSESLMGKINDAESLWKYISDVSAGLAYLHAFDPTIVHHDIKPANVLIDDVGNYAITDFGISSHRGLNREGYDDSQSGTMAYMAPERFREDYESMPESDIWSFGATLYELITGKVPFGENGGLSQLDGTVTLQPISAPVPHDGKTLITDCLSPDPTKRPSARKIFQTAETHRSSHRKKLWVIAAFAAMVFAGVLAGVLLLRKEEGPPAPTPVDPVQLTPSDEEIYQNAKAMMVSDNADTLRRALSILEALGGKGYVPALYEQAYTYGWYSDKESLRRKSVLGIKVFPAGTQGASMPTSYQLNIKAIGLFTDIAERGDSAWPQLNSEALYRLACYYNNSNKLLQKNETLARKYLLQAHEWAKRCDDSTVINQVERGLNLLK